MKYPAKAAASGNTQSHVYFVPTLNKDILNKEMKKILSPLESY